MVVLEKLVLKINGEKQRVTTDTGVNAISLFPTQQYGRTDMAFSNLIPAVLDGAATEVIDIEVTYKGYSAEQYITRESARYDATLREFIRNGAEYR